MIIRQLSAFLENKPGAMTAILQLFKGNEINLRALTLSDAAEFGGILRIIVKEPDEVEELLRGSGYIVKNEPVLTITLEDDPGSLFEKMQLLSDAGINIEYTYAFAASAESEARVVFKTDKLELAEKLLKAQNQEIHDDNLPQLYW